MKNLMWISTHYLKKNFLNPTNLIIIGLPLVFSFAFFLANNYILEMIGIEMPLIANLTIPLVLGFQFFGADLTSDWLHHDLKGPTRSRLLVSPIDQRVFFGGVILTGWLFNVFYGSIVVAVTSIVFGVDWGNYGLVLLVMLCFSFMAQFVGVLIFYFTKDEKSGTRLAYVFGEIMLGITFLPVLVSATNFGERIDSIANYLPVNMGMNIIANNYLVSNLAIILGIIAILGVVIFLVGRHRSDNI
ncbi:MAG: hypothetical protein FWC77_01170 [Defluviitaleaceae bacterium]|nr:hypothetical protein [Defluviitaleaceae bacterium]